MNATQRDVSQALSAFERDGYVVLERAVDADTIERIRAELSPWLGDEAFRGRNDFEGFLSNRVYALLAKAPAIATLVEHPWVLAMLDQLLLPNFLLSANLAINLLPGETAQQFHIDDDFYRVGRPRPPISVTRDLGDRRVHRRERRDGGRSPVAIGGATRVPGDDHPRRQGRDARRFGRRLRRHAVAPRRRQPQRSSPPRDHAAVLRAVGPPAGDSRSCPSGRERREYSERIQSLLGYSIHPPFMGHVNGLHPLRLLDPQLRQRRRRRRQGCRRLLDRARRPRGMRGILPWGLTTWERRRQLERVQSSPCWVIPSMPTRPPCWPRCVVPD